MNVVKMRFPNKLLTLFIGFLGLHNLHAQTNEVRPNVIVIYSDDQGWTDINSFGG